MDPLLILLVGLAIGTWIRLRMERPRTYIGALPAVAPLPGDVVDARAAVLDTRHHEQQIREAVQVA